MTHAYVPRRDFRFDHASDAVNHIEFENCTHGCQRGSLDPEMPGGACEILARVSVGDGVAVPELRDDGTVITCLAREAY